MGIRFSHPPDVLRLMWVLISSFRDWCTQCVLLEVQVRVEASYQMALWLRVQSCVSAFGQVSETRSVPTNRIMATPFTYTLAGFCHSASCASRVAGLGWNMWGGALWSNGQKFAHTSPPNVFTYGTGKKLRDEP